MRPTLIIAAASLIALASTASAQEVDREQLRSQWEAMGIEDYQAPEVAQYQATLIEGYTAVEAGQGAAADTDHFYAIVNYVIGKYDRETGDLVDRWKGTRGGPIGHLNSCYPEDGKLYCANSNHPKLPMGSSIEIFDTATMTHEASKSLGMMDEGSLVWFDHYKDGWIAGFAHYDDETGLPFKNHSYASIVMFDKQWRRTGGYMLPSSILDRMAPQAASGGAMGDDGYLYIMGHDLPEMYVMRFPQMGPYMEHVATIDVPAEGQAFAFDTENPRQIWAISRPTRQVRHFSIPIID